MTDLRDYTWTIHEIHEAGDAGNATRVTAWSLDVRQDGTLVFTDRKEGVVLHVQAPGTYKSCVRDMDITQEHLDAQRAHEEEYRRKLQPTFSPA